MRSPFDEAGTLAASCRSNCCLPDTMQCGEGCRGGATALCGCGIVDATGMGWGVFDRLKLLGVPNVFAIEFSRSPDRVNFDDPIWSLPRSRSRSRVRDDLMPNRRLPVDKCRHFPDCPRLEAEITAAAVGERQAADHCMLQCAHTEADGSALCKGDHIHDDRCSDRH